MPDETTKPEASTVPAVLVPKPGDDVLFWPERKPFIQQSFKAKVMGVPEQQGAAPVAQLLVTNHQTGRTFNVDAAELSSEPKPGCFGYPPAPPKD